MVALVAGPVIVGLLVVVAFMAFRMARLHGELADLNRLVARMVLSGSLAAARAQAEAYRRRKDAE